jgi:thymidine phosphorylase
MVTALGGPADLLEQPEFYLAAAPLIRPIPALRSGIVSNIDCRALGLAVVSLGGGRRRPEDQIDYAVGFTGFAELGATIAAGEPLAFVHARDEAQLAQIVPDVQAAYCIGDSAAIPPTLHGSVD